MAILVLNAGSSSLKFAVYEPRDLSEVLRGQVSGIGTTPRLECGGVKESLPVNISYRDGLAILLDWLKKQKSWQYELKDGNLVLERLDPNAEISAQR